MSGFMTKIVGFTITYATWVTSGCPRRDPVEVVELWHTKCVACDWYDLNLKIPGGLRVGGCKKCGCHVSDDAHDLLNLITLPTKPCPMGYFGAVVNSEKTT